MFNYFTSDLKTSTKISLISPIYMGGNSLEKLVEESSKSLAKFSDNFEIILVNDGSPDNSWEEITRLSKSHKSIRAICLDKNYGQHPAILEGLKISKGELIVVIDCDLQEPPSAIPELIKNLNGNEYVLAKRANRKSSLLEKFTSALFYMILRLTKGVAIDPKTANFGVFKRGTINKLLLNKSKFKYFPLAIAQTKEKHTRTEIPHTIRHEGSSSYNFISRFKLAFFILSNKKPIDFVSIKTSINV